MAPCASVCVYRPKIKGEERLAEIFRFQELWRWIMKFLGEQQGNWVISEGGAVGMRPAGVVWRTPAFSYSLCCTPLFLPTPKPPDPTHAQTQMSLCIRMFVHINGLSWTMNPGWPRWRAWCRRAQRSKKSLKMPEFQHFLLCSVEKPDETWIIGQQLAGQKTMMAKMHC